MDLNSKSLLEKLIRLQNDYASTYRAMVTGERLKRALSISGEVDVLAESNREPLIEHVGHLPIIACTLYPYLEHKHHIDLGRVLIMLSIHDIGETVTGDVMAYKKSADDSQTEYEEALKIIPGDLLPYFEEFEKQETLDSKFAKVVDASAPFLHELTTPNLTRLRFKAHGFDSKKIEVKKTSLFAWDETLKSLFATVMESYRRIERFEETGLPVLADIQEES